MRNVRWYIVGILFLATLINYVDRQTLSFLAPVLTDKFHLSAPEYAFAVQSFLFAYACGFLLSGMLVDRLGSKASLSIFMVGWSLASASHALVSGIAGLALCRFWLGLSEAGNFPAATRVVSEWFPPKERAIATGIYAMGAMVGAVIAPPLVVWTALHFGWQWAFGGTAILGLIWLLIWFFFYYAPEEHPLLSIPELRHIKAGRDPDARHSFTKPVWLRCLGFPAVRGLAAASFIADPLWYFYLFWLPQYLKEYRGLSLSQIGAIAWLPYLSADLGSLAGGLTSSFAIARGRPPVKARSQTLLAFMTLIMFSSVMIIFSRSTGVTFSLICLASFGCLGWMVNLATLINDLFPQEYVGSIKGIERTGSALGGILFVYVVGQFFNARVYLPVFIIMSTLHPVATAILLYHIHSNKSVSSMGNLVIC